MFSVPLPQATLLDLFPLFLGAYIHCASCLPASSLLDQSHPWDLRFDSTLEGNGADPILFHKRSLIPKVHMGVIVTSSFSRTLHKLGSYVVVHNLVACFPELWRLAARSVWLAEFPAFRVLSKMRWWWIG